MNWNKFAILIFIGLAVFALIFFTQRPDVLSNVWLWLVGLSGLIIQGVKSLFGFISKGSELEPHALTAQPATSGQPTTAQRVVAAAPAQVSVPATIPQTVFDGITLTVLRYSDDGQTTIGLLYLNGRYYCYTLEDTFQPTKIPGRTRIPAGEYMVDFNRTDTPKTLKYRKEFPDWFTYHLEIKNVPGFQDIYIHNGGTNVDTAGCLLVSDGLTMSAASTFLTNSKNTFQSLYIHLKDLLTKGIKIRLIIRDESWFAQITQRS